MKTLVTLLGTIGLAFTNANNFLNINNSPKEVKEITYEFSENKKDIVHSYKTSSVSNPAYESWDFVVSTGLKSFQKPKSIRILEWFLNNGSDKIDWGSEHYDVFSVPLKIMGKEINKINEGKITDEEVAYNRMNFSFKESYKDFLATAEVVRGITTALFFDNLDWHIQFLFPAKLTFECMLIIIVNKIDLPSAEPEKVKEEIEKVLGLPADYAPLISAKTGINIRDVLEAVIKYIPYPIDADDNEPLRALIFDSLYDKYRGVMAFIRIKTGVIKVGDKVRMMSTGAEYEITELGVRTPKEEKREMLTAGEVGWISGAIKIISDIHVGDTITSVINSADAPLPGYKTLKPMVYCGLYPIDTNKYQELKDALYKIQLSDASLIFTAETSQALGFGFRCGFLGLLHMDVIQERLEREYNLVLISTAPSVIYEVNLTNGEKLIIDNPAKWPTVQTIKSVEEPFVQVTIMTPEQYVGALMQLCQDKRGTYLDLKYADNLRRTLIYNMPLNEIVIDFFDKLKSISKGYASLDYELIGYQESKLVKMDILLAGNIVDALSVIVHKDFAYDRGRVLCEKLKKLIPKQNFEVAIQAAINNKIIARQTVQAVRKDVIAKCYGGDITRKRKLLEKQKEGKKKMKSIGNVELPPEAFRAVLKIDEEN